MKATALRQSRLITAAAASAAFAFCAAVDAADALDAELREIDGRRVLFLSGEVLPGDESEVVERLAAGDFDEVWLHSRGGDVEAGYAIGYAIRERRLVTRVSSRHICASACVDIFLGGLIRFADPGALLVIHPGSISNSTVLLSDIRSIEDDDEARSTIRLIERRTTDETANWAQYLNFMGVSVELVNRAAEVDFSQGICLTQREMVYYNIVNTSGAPDPAYRPGPPVVNCWR